MNKKKEVYIVNRIARRFLDILGEYRLYFSRGYSFYFAIFLSLFSTSVIAYEFVVKDSPFMSSIFTRQITFILAFLVVLVSSSTALGKFDYMRGTYKSETETVMKYNPIWQKVFKIFNKQDKKFDYIIERLEKLERLEKRIEELEKIEKKSTKRMT